MRQIQKKGALAVAKSAKICISVDPQIKSDVEAIYSKYGLSIADAVRIFFHTSKIVGGIPFELHPEALKASGRNVKSEKGRFKSTDDMLSELKERR